MKRLLQYLKKKSRQGVGIRFGRYLLSARIVKRPLSSTRLGKNSTAGLHEMMLLRQVRFLERRFDELRLFQLHSNAANSAEVLDFYNAYIPLIYEKAKGSHLRSLLSRLREKTGDENLARQATLEIAKSDLADGIPERAQILADDPEYSHRLQEETNRFEQSYGYPTVSEHWPEPSRGRSLLYYFSNHESLVQGKSILHIAPEVELRAWFVDNQRRLEIDYLTLDAFNRTTDIQQDITDMSEIPTDKYDLVICHRVLEHILDDASAIEELSRVLKPCGVLNVSVPQCMQISATSEWVTPDASHHDHVRQYGRDFPDRLVQQGFDVDDTSWLLHRSRDELLANRAFPLRVYNARKQAA